jgi:UDP-N-acetylmuramoyl-tripeptide--D-alanyl-D-alanine ligase
MLNLFLVFIVLFLLAIFTKTLRFLHFAQKRWFRIDRLKVFVSQESGISQISNPINIFFYGLLVVALLSAPQFNMHAALLVIFAEICSVWHKGLYRPKFTLKVLLLIIMTLATSLLIPICFSQFPAFLAVFLLLPAILMFYIILLKPFEFVVFKTLYKLAEIKVKLHPNLKVVAITGSFGKSSTKEFISALVEKDFNVLKTPKNTNTEIGITKLILKNLKKSHNLLILEMGAYKKGEIQTMCQIARPHISVLTAVDVQHLALFGSKTKLAQAKAEILLNMHDTATAFVNLDSRSVATALNYVYAQSPLDMRIQTYGKAPNSQHKMSAGKLQDKHLIFNLDKNSYKTQIYGTHFANNIAAAILVAQKLGIKADIIKKRVAKLSNTLITSQLHQHSKKFLVFNDSFNSNPQGFLAAIDTIQQTPNVKHKYLLTSGMLELGSLNASEHRKVFAQACKVFDKIILTKKHLVQYLPKSYKNYKVLTQPQEIIAYFNKTLKPSDIVLLEGHTFELVCKYFQKK